MDRYKINSDLFKQVNFNIENLIGKNLLQYKQEFSGISRLIESMNRTNFSHLLQPSSETSRLLKALSQSKLSSQFGSDKNRLIELTKGLDIGLNKNVISSLSRTVIEDVSVVNSNTNIEDKIEVEKQFIKDGFTAERKEIENLLITIASPDLIPMWRGALAALNSIDNPDYARHCAVSLREFFTQIIHRLSPDEDIKEWTEDPQFFDRGRPTRKARLLFICRSINDNIFSDFLEKDVEAILEFVKLFQRGTHQVTIPFTHKQLLALKAKVEYAVNFLIKIAQLNE